MNLLRPLVVKIGAWHALPRFAPLVVALDRLLQRLTRGRVTLAGLIGLPELVLVVRGRRTGLVRRTPLLYTLGQGGYLVAGSNWGRPRPPAWTHNLRACPDAAVEVRGRRVDVRARQLHGQERAEAWRKMVGTWPNYEEYAWRTGREIPVFVLEPR